MGLVALLFSIIACLFHDLVDIASQIADIFLIEFDSSAGFPHDAVDLFRRCADIGRDLLAPSKLLICIVELLKVFRPEEVLGSLVYLLHGVRSLAEVLRQIQVCQFLPAYGQISHGTCYRANTEGHCTERPEKCAEAQRKMGYDPSDRVKAFDGSPAEVECRYSSSDSSQDTGDSGSVLNDPASKAYQGVAKSRKILPGPAECPADRRVPLFDLVRDVF